MTKLSVNLNKIALLRNQRDIGIPSVVESAKVVITAGVAGITVHPRPDERHIRYSDVYELKDTVSCFGGVEYNIEGNPFTGRYMELVKDVQPDQATLVPDDPNQNTSDHGWDIDANLERLKPVVEELKLLDIRVSLFMDAEQGIEKAAKALADRVELYTEPYATAFRTGRDLDETLRRFATAAAAAQDAGLDVNAGHDLNLENLGMFLDEVEEVKEVSIGHALIAEALEMGLYNTVKEYLRILGSAL
ncbi:MAG: pyridoxine 5'-phosphate synthase [Phycisphaerales bacterium]|jgi:pyridoxine 5-phosphate synthase